MTETGNYMDNFLAWLESTTPEERLSAGRSRRDDLMATCAHPESERQKLHHNGIPIELCRACEHTRGFKARLAPATGQWGEWMPGTFGWAAAPLFALPFFFPGEMFIETAVDQWRRENGVDPITGEPV